jgi:hypothetical protein
VKRTTRPIHVDVANLDPIRIDDAAHGGTVRVHANPEHRRRREPTARDDRHAMRRLLHDAERDPAAEVDGP